MEQVEIPVEHPRGYYPVRIDDKGRLKLPADFKRYLEELKEIRVFCTSFDLRIGRIYTISAWKDVEKLLTQPGEDAEDAEDLWFGANAVGGDAEMDAQGRLSIPGELRKALSIENAQVWVGRYRNYLELFGEEVYRERELKYKANLPQKLSKFKKMGL